MYNNYGICDGHFSPAEIVLNLHKKVQCRLLRHPLSSFSRNAFHFSRDKPGYSRFSRDTSGYSRFSREAPRSTRDKPRFFTATSCFSRCVTFLSRITLDHQLK